MLNRIARLGSERLNKIFVQPFGSPAPRLCSTFCFLFDLLLKRPARPRSARLGSVKGLRHHPVCSDPAACSPRPRPRPMKRERSQNAERRTQNQTAAWAVFWVLRTQNAGCRLRTQGPYSQNAAEALLSSIARMALVTFPFWLFIFRLLCTMTGNGEFWLMVAFLVFGASSSPGGCNSGPVIRFWHEP